MPSILPGSSVNEKVPCSIFNKSSGSKAYTDISRDAIVYEDGTSMPSSGQTTVKEVNDQTLFEHDYRTPYIEDANRLYRRFGNFFKKNGEKSFSYRDINNKYFGENAKIDIEDEAYLQMYVADLGFTPEQCETIWRAAYYDYQDYLPKWQKPIFTTIEKNIKTSNTSRKMVTKTRKVITTVIETETVPDMKTGQKPITDLIIPSTKFSSTYKDIIEFVPDQNYSGPFTLSMNTSHWYGFSILEFDDIDEEWHKKFSEGLVLIERVSKIEHPFETTLERSNLYNGELKGIPADDKYAKHNNNPLSITMNVGLIAGRKYKIRTVECPGGGEDPSCFQYTFPINTDNNLIVQYEYEGTKEIQKEVEKEIEEEYEEEEEITEVGDKTVTVVEHIYMGYYPEERRQEYIEEINTTFKEIVNICKSLLGIKYKPRNISELYQNSASYSEEEKVKIVKIIHDYLIINNKYGNSYMDHSLYAAMSKGKFAASSCAIALAFKHCCSRFGIIAQIIVGQCYYKKSGEKIPNGMTFYWNRVCYVKGNIKESLYLKDKSISVQTEASVNAGKVMEEAIKKYDADFLNNYCSNGSFNKYTDLYYFDENFEGNIVTNNILKSHTQYDKSVWTEIDLVYDMVSQGERNTPKWTFFNVPSSRFYQRQDAGYRMYPKYMYTNFGSECYANYAGQDNHYDQLISLKSGPSYTGNEIYKW